MCWCCVNVWGFFKCTISGCLGDYQEACGSPKCRLGGIFCSVTWKVKTYSCTDHVRNCSVMKKYDWIFLHIQLQLNRAWAILLGKKGKENTQVRGAGQIRYPNPNKLSELQRAINIWMELSREDSYQTLTSSYCQPAEGIHMTSLWYNLEKKNC